MDAYPAPRVGALIAKSKGMWQLGGAVSDRRSWPRWTPSRDRWAIP